MNNMTRNKKRFLAGILLVNLCGIMPEKQLKAGTINTIATITVLGAGTAVVGYLVYTNARWRWDLGGRMADTAQAVAATNRAVSTLGNTLGGQVDGLDGRLTVLTDQTAENNRQVTGRLDEANQRLSALEDGIDTNTAAVNSVADQVGNLQTNITDILNNTEQTKRFLQTIVIALEHSGLRLPASQDLQLLVESATAEQVASSSSSSSSGPSQQPVLNNRLFGLGLARMPLNTGTQESPALNIFTQDLSTGNNSKKSSSKGKEKLTNK